MNGSAKSAAQLLIYDDHSTILTMAQRLRVERLLVDMMNPPLIVSYQVPRHPLNIYEILKCSSGHTGTNQTTNGKQL